MIRDGRLTRFRATRPYESLVSSSLVPRQRIHRCASSSSPANTPPMQGGVGDYTRRLSQALGELGAATCHVLTRCERRRRSPARAHRRPTSRPSIRCSTAHGLATCGERRCAFIRQLRPDVVHIQYQSAAYGLAPGGQLSALAARGRCNIGRPPASPSMICVSRISSQRRGRCGGRPCWRWRWAATRA